MTTSLDPRVQRTQQHVLEQARRLLLEEGPVGLTFSALSHRAQVARQTLYRYWDSPEDLVADLIRRRTSLTAPVTGTAVDVLRGYLTALRDSLQDPAVTASWGMLMASRAHVPAAGAALQVTLDSQLAALNERLSGLRAPMTGDEYAVLVGPIVQQHFIAGQPAGDELIAGLAAWFGTCPTTRSSSAG